MQSQLCQQCHFQIVIPWQHTAQASKSTHESRRRRCTVLAQGGIPAVGIDLGTSNTVVAVMQQGSPSVVPVHGQYSTPSVVAYTPDGVQVGAAAQALARSDPSNAFSSMKRLIGRSWQQLRQQPDAASHGIVQGQEGQAALHCPATDGLLLPEEVCAELLRAVLAATAEHLGCSTPQAVITVPAHFSPEQRDATRRAAVMSGLQQVELLQEPVAAALMHGLGSPAESGTILVFDLGGGTLDVSLVDSFEGTMEVLATAGDSQLGGDDFDNAIVTWLVQSGACSEEQARDRQLLHAAEQAKQRLSEHVQAAIALPHGSSTVTLSRQAFDQLIAPLLQRMQAPLQHLAATTKLQWADHAAAAADLQPCDRYAPPPRRVTDLVLIGGSSYIPAVRCMMQRKAGVPPHSGVHPEHCVALGAALHAGALTGQVEGMSLVEGSSLWPEKAAS